MNWKEVRIGNSVEYQYRPGEWSHCYINPVDIEALGWPDKQKNYRGIPLTPEVLEQTGLPIGESKRDANGYPICEGYYWAYDGLCCDYTEGDGGVHLIGSPKYLHKLQNLFYEIAEFELPLKETK